MWIEDDELRVFCVLLSEAYLDHYIEPSKEWADLPAKDLETEFKRFEKKKYQAETATNQSWDGKRLQRLHFWFEPECRDGATSEEDTVFQQIKDVLEPLGAIRNSLDLKKAYLALRWMLEDDGCYISKAIQKKLSEVKVSIDSSRVTEWDKKHIAIQATAQVIAYEKGDFNIKKIKELILKFDEGMKRLLYLNEWKSALNYDESEDAFEAKDRAKTMERLISSINPIPKGKRKGRHPNVPRVIREIVFIPGIFDERDGITKINFRKLKIAFYYLAVILAFKRYSSDAIKKHPIILKYAKPIPVFFHSLLDCWIDEALKMVDFC